MARHNVIGERGEETARKFLEHKGYRILSRNFRTRYAELDLVCESPGRDSLIFVEVRTRTGEWFGTPEDTIDVRKRRRLVRAAEAYVAFRHYTGPYRIDAVCVVFERGPGGVNDGALLRIDHYENITG